MKILRILILFFVFFLSSITQAQKMKDLFTYIVNDYYNVLCSNGVISKQDSVHFICGFNECRDNCFGYEIESTNNRIQFNLPHVDIIHPNKTFYSLSPPELKKQSLVINLSIYTMLFREHNQKEFIYSGTVEYEFRYSKRKAQYVLRSKNEFGI